MGILTLKSIKYVMLSAGKMGLESTKPGAKSGRRKHFLATMSHPQSKREAQKGKPLPKEVIGTQSGHSKRKKKSGTAKDKNPSQPLASTPVVAKLHKEALQETNGPTSLGVTGHDASADSTAEADHEKSAPKDLLSQQQEITQSSDDDEEIKLEDLSKLVKDTGVEVMDLDTPKDDTLLLVLKVHGEAGIEIPGDLKELPGKLEEFQSSISAPTSKVSAFDNFKLDIQADLLALPKQVSSINAQLSKLKVLDALPNLLNKVSEALDRFENDIDKASHKTGDESVPLAGQAGTHLV
ncbi:hypothetical protein Tco_1190957 [Tanacetum coccineum]